VGALRQDVRGDTRPKALDLFCGAGGATRGLQLAGFHVTGVDIAAHRYCGDAFHQADALTFPIEGFDFVWASPPCQAFTALRFMPTARKHPNLIPQTRARLVASGVPYCIENVEGAPLGDSGYLILLCGTMFGLQTADGRAELRRHRLFETSFSIPLRPACQHGGAGGGAVETVSVAGRRAIGGHYSRRAITVTGSTAQTNLDRNRTRETFSVQQAREAMGIDWMSMATLSQAIPPAYAEFIGRQAMRTNPDRTGGLSTEPPPSSETPG
jgi:DNA (cytosine-5)-methyltransferase 1